MLYEVITHFAFTVGSWIGRNWCGGFYCTDAPLPVAKKTDRSSLFSDWLGMDRTTLVRNLRPLERDGLVKSTGHGRGNKVSLTLRNNFV